MGFRDRIVHAWNAFKNEEEKMTDYYGPSIHTSTSRTSNARRYISNERVLLDAIKTRIAIDATSVEFRHCRVDEDERFVEEIDSGLNRIFKFEANLDQSARAYAQDVVYSALDWGHVVMAPVDATMDPTSSGSWDVQSMRAGYVTDWFANYVKVNCYDERTGERKTFGVPKRVVGIFENPMISVMNEPNSTLQRIIKKLNILDVVDEQLSSGRLDLIIQLPYGTKSESKQIAAQQRLDDIEEQMKGSQYGIAYIDVNEKITQLNRPAENNLMAQIDKLMEMLYGQLGITAGVLNGTAPEAEMLNYRARTLEPIWEGLAQEYQRKMITKTARTQGQRVLYFADRFKLATMEQLADIFDVMSRNEIGSGNEMRQVIGWRPSKDPRANELRNSNMPIKDLTGETGAAPAAEGGDAEQSAMDDLESTIDEIFSDLEVDSGSG